MISSSRSNATVVDVINCAYDAGNRETSRLFGNGLTASMTYRADNTKQSITVNESSVTLADLSFSYSYDANKNVTAETYDSGSVLSSSNFTASYDPADRITGWNRSGGESQNWTLDLIGNWNNTAGNLSGSTFNENRSHNDTHELTAIAGTALSYDAKGNMTVNQISRDFTWDIDNHLSNVSETAGNVADYEYDALGRRVKKTVASSGKQTVFVCMGQRVVSEHKRNDSSSPYELEREYVYVSYIDDIAAKIEIDGASESTLYYHRDRQYNVRGLTDSNGDVQELYTYTAYGQQQIFDSLGTARASTAQNNLYGFTGRYLDEETGLWYFRARYFDDGQGRFISRDPLGHVDGFNLYAGYFAESYGLDPTGTTKLPQKLHKHFQKMYDNVAWLIKNKQISRCAGMVILMAGLYNFYFDKNKGATRGSGKRFAVGSFISDAMHYFMDPTHRDTVIDGVNQVVKTMPSKKPWKNKWTPDKVLTDHGNTGIDEGFVQDAKKDGDADTTGRNDHFIGNMAAVWVYGRAITDLFEPEESSSTDNHINQKAREFTSKIVMNPTAYSYKDIANMLYKDLCDESKCKVKI